MQSIPEGTMIVAVFGGMLLIGGWICWLGSIAHRNPGVSAWDVFAGTGRFQRRQDYTPEGWRLVCASRIMTAAGMALFFAAFWLLTP